MTFADDLLIAAVAPVASRRLGTPDALKPTLEKLREDFGDDPGAVPAPEDVAPVVRLLRTGRQLSARQVAACCAAAATVVDDRRILESADDVEQLLRLLARGPGRITQSTGCA